MLKSYGILVDEKLCNYGDDCTGDTDISVYALGSSGDKGSNDKSHNVRDHHNGREEILYLGSLIGCNRLLFLPEH